MNVTLTPAHIAELLLGQSVDAQAEDGREVLLDGVDFTEVELDLVLRGEQVAKIIDEAPLTLAIALTGWASGDGQALDAINEILSAPEWASGMLEDINELVRGTGRAEVPGAIWDRH
jgi:hypothetical protein